MDKLKTVLLNHGEKIVAGLFGLFAFLALTSASWSSNPHNPLELETLTKKGEAQITQNQWPEEDKVLFEEIPDVESMVRDNEDALTNSEEFEIANFNPSIFQVKEKRTGVKVLAPEDPVSVAVVFPLAKPPEEDEEADPDDPDADATETEKSDEQMSEDERIEKLLAQRYAPNAGAAGLPGMGAPGLPGAEGIIGGAEYAGGGGEYAGGGGEYAGGGGEYAGGGGAGAGYGMADGGAIDYGGYGGDYGSSELSDTYGTTMMSVKKNIRVTAGVSVRMIVDLQKQRNILRQALHLPADYRLAQQYIKYVDLVVERRQKEEGPNAWSNWEPKSSEDLGEILKESFGIDRDIVSPAVTRNTITMPLPRRAAGEWAPDEASHPRVEKFELSREEKELFDKFNQRLTEKLALQKEALPEVVEQKGFSQFVQNSTDIGLMYQGAGGMGAGGMGSEYMNAMAGGGGYEGGAGGGYESAYDYNDFASSSMGGEQLTDEQRQLLDETKATADHRLLLVRFMDFTVARGTSYQYRVRLVMENPNYNHPPDELVDPGLGFELTLHSDWSDPSPAVSVPVSHRLYLTGVEGRPGTQERVSVSVFTDAPETGLPVMGDIKALMGLPLAGKQNVEVVDLTTEEVAFREVTLRTDELLSAAEEIQRPSSSEHPELKTLLDQTRGKVLVPDQICVVDSTGALRLRAVGENPLEEKLDRRTAEEILKIYDGWKKKKEPDSFFGAGEGYEGGGAGGGGEYGMGMSLGASSAGGYYGGGGSGSSKSSRRRNKGRRSQQKAAAGRGAGGYESSP